MTTMKQKYIDEVERHLEVLLPTIKGKSYPIIADLLYHTIEASKKSVDVREHNMSVLRRQVNGTPYPDQDKECFVKSKEWRFKRGK